MLNLTDIQIMNISTLAAAECVRQHVGIDRVAFLLQAYEYALKTSSERALPTEADALLLAGMIEPTSHGRYRITPVTFAGGGSAAAPSVVPSATARLFAFLEAGIEPEEFTHSYLSIHPLSDGNGRTAFVLHNWVSGTLKNPMPLPDWKW